MGDSNDKNPNTVDFSDIDWDSALDEWERGSFRPELAQDAEAGGAKNAASEKHESHEASKPGPHESAPKIPLAAPNPAPPRPGIPEAPKVVRPDAPPAADVRRRGGLGPLFARGPSASRPMSAPLPPLAPLDFEDDAPDERTRVAMPVIELEEFSDAETVTHLSIGEAARREAAEEASSLIVDEVVDLDAEATAIAIDVPSAPQIVEPANEPVREREAPRTPPTELEDEGSGIDVGLMAVDATGLRARAAWLEGEARAETSSERRARALLLVSELHVLFDDLAGAAALADEARTLDPSVALAAIQARHLASSAFDHDANDETERSMLDREAEHAPTIAAKVHATLLSAEHCRFDSSETDRGIEAAVERWTRARDLDPNDVRPAVLLAASALGDDRSDPREQASSGVASDAPEFDVLRDAVATACALRGIEHATDGTRPHARELPVNDALRRMRRAFENQDLAEASRAAADLADGREPAFTTAAHWLSASLGSITETEKRRSVEIRRLLASQGHRSTLRSLAAGGIELEDADMLRAALEDDAPFSATERVVLSAFADRDVSEVLRDMVGSAADDPLLFALSASKSPTEAGAMDRESEGGELHARVAFGRLLARRPSIADVDRSLAELPDHLDATLSGVVLENASRARRWNELGRAVESMASEDVRESASLARALFAERAGVDTDAAEAWASALSASASAAEKAGLLRALVARSPREDRAEVFQELVRSIPEDLEGAVLRLEALERGGLDDAERDAMLQGLHRGLEAFDLAAFLGEQEARERGDDEDALRWIDEARSRATDPLEVSIGAVRAADLVASKDADQHRSRLADAHRARPDDVALRSLWERAASASSEDDADEAGRWREERAEKARGSRRVRWLLESAFAYARAGDSEAVLRVAKRAEESGDKGLSRLVREDAELALGQGLPSTEHWLKIAKETSDETSVREAYERLATVDGEILGNASGALLWHRALLESHPQSLPSLRFVEHALVEERREDEFVPIFEQIAKALVATEDAEVSGHAQLAAAFALRQDAIGGISQAADMARLASETKSPSLWSLRAHNAYARFDKDDEAQRATSLALAERTSRPAERSALFVRASESTKRLGRDDEAREWLEKAVLEHPDAWTAWNTLVDVYRRSGDVQKRAEAQEQVARTSAVTTHRRDAWFEAALAWLERADPDRAMHALERCAEIDVTYRDTFERLSGLYAERGLREALARLLERRLETVHDPAERVTLEVELARTLAETGDTTKAKAALEIALRQVPDHTTALSAMAELCSREKDWSGAEQSYVRLARLLPSSDEQRAIYERLGEIYAVHLAQLPRAEIAYKEVLKRAPNDTHTLEKLVDVHRRQNDWVQAASVQQKLVEAATTSAERSSRALELAALFEAGNELRKAEQVFEAVRKENPTSVVALRAMAEFYGRQRQIPAMQILLDRAASDTRRAFSAGRFDPALFEILNAAYELRGKKDVARIVSSTVSAISGSSAGPSSVRGAEAHAIDPKLDDLLAPELVGPALRFLLSRVGDVLDVVSPLDLRALQAAPLPPGTPLSKTVGSVATVIGLGALQIAVSPKLGRVALPIPGKTPTLVVGEPLVHAPDERARAFVVVRALKMLTAKASALFRVEPKEAGLMASALFMAFNPSLEARGENANVVAELARKITTALPRGLDPTLGVVALEAGGTLGNDVEALGKALSGWADRVALLATGDPSAALEGLAWLQGMEHVPDAGPERMAFLARSVEARDLLAFSVGDAYVQARAKLDLDR